MKTRSSLFKQSSALWIGPVVESLMVCLPFLGILNFAFIAITMYTGIRPFIEGPLPWMRLWIFLLLLVTTTVAMMFLVWKFVLSPLWVFRGKQMLEDELITRLDGIEDSLKKLQDTRTQQFGGTRQPKEDTVDSRLECTTTRT